MSGKALFGALKMDILVVTPFNVDAPLFSYYRTRLMGIDSVVAELDDTRVDKTKSMQEDGAAVDKVLDEYSDLTYKGDDLGWMSPAHYPQSTVKSGNKATSPRLDALSASYLEAYLKMTKDALACDSEAKKKAVKEYTDEILEKGGLIADQLVKGTGKDFTRDFCNKCFLGTDIND